MWFVDGKMFVVEGFDGFLYVIVEYIIIVIGLVFVELLFLFYLDCVLSLVDVLVL